MRIKDLVIPGSEILVAGLIKLQADYTIFFALDQFLKLKISGSLPVYEQGIYIGNLALIDITNYLFNEYKIEKNKRYNFARNITGKVIKLQNLVKELTLPEQKLTIAAQCEGIITASKDYI